MLRTYAVHVPALSLPEAAMLPALQTKKDAPTDASLGDLPGENLRGVDVAIAVLHNADAYLRPRGGENVAPVAR